MKNIANALTIFRIVLIPFFLFFLLQESVPSIVIAVIIFIIASMTDLYDGYLARNTSKVTNFGIIMDPIADKLMVLSALIAFVQLDIVQSWIVIVIIAREFLVTVLRTFALAKSRVIASIKSGKHKTVSQMVAIISILAMIEFDRVFGLKLQETKFIFLTLPNLFVFASMLMSVISAVDVLIKNKNLLWDDMK